MKLLTPILSAAMYLSSSVDAGVVWGEKCPVWGTGFTTVSTLDLNQYIGIWYEMQHDSESPFQWWGECVFANYTIKDEATSMVGVKNRGWFWWNFFSYSGVDGQAKCRSNEGRCYVNFTEGADMD